MKYNNPITFFCPIAVPYFSLPYLPRYNTLKFIYGIGTCDQMVKLFFNIWLFATTKTNPVMKQICQIRNKPSKNCQRLVKFCQSGEISPNLVTLDNDPMFSSLCWCRSFWHHDSNFVFHLFDDCDNNDDQKLADPGRADSLQLSCQVRQRLVLFHQKPDHFCWPKHFLLWKLINRTRPLLVCNSCLKDHQICQVQK